MRARYSVFEKAWNRAPLELAACFLNHEDRAHESCCFSLGARLCGRVAWGTQPATALRTARARPCENLSMPFSRVVENRIREAMAQGQFENLPGAGRPCER